MTAAPPGGRPGRLLWVNHFAVAADMGGGTRHIELAQELVNLGWQVTLAASDFHLHRRTYTRRPSVTHRSPVHETIGGVDVAWLWSSPYEHNNARRIGNWLSFSASLLRADLGGAPDVVIGSSPHLFAAAAALRLARKRRASFVLEVRDLWPESLQVTGRRRGPGFWLLWGLAQYLYRAADHIVVLARGTARHLARLGVPEQRLTFVPNGVDVAAFRVHAPAPRDGLRLVYAGAHGPANGLDIVVRAARLIRDDPRVSFLLVGDGPAKPELRRQACELGLGNVEFAEPVPKSLMPELLATCDAGLMVLTEAPLFSFGVSPNKLFDYWGAALPVLCNVPGEVASWVREAGGGVQATDGSAEALARAIRTLVELSPGARRLLGESGRAWVAREHDRPVLARRLHDMLLPLVASGR